MKLRNNIKRIFWFAIGRLPEVFDREFWNTIQRVWIGRFDYFNRISKAEFIANIRMLERRPWNLHIELTNICNADCIFCAYRFQKRKKIIMDKKIYSKALHDYCAMGGGELRLETCVGDPLMDPCFLERVKEARSYHEITEIYTLTNGINLDKFEIENILRSGITEIGISTGPWKKDLYELIYGVGQYQKMHNNVTELLRKNVESGEPIRIKLLFRSSLPMKKTLELPDYQQVRHLRHKVEFNTDFDTWLDTIKQHHLINGMHIRPAVAVEHEPCYWFYDGPMIFADGKVGLCGCRDFNADSELIIGNIREAALLQLWQSDSVKQLRRCFWKGNIPSICKRCSTYANLDFYRTKRGSLRARSLIIK